MNPLESGNRLKFYHNKAFTQQEKILDYELNFKVSFN